MVTSEELRRLGDRVLVNKEPIRTAAWNLFIDAVVEALDVDGLSGHLTDEEYIQLDALMYGRRPAEGSARP